MSDPADAIRGPSSPIRQRTVDVFISYAHEDSEVASALAGAIEARGFTTWSDAMLGAGQPLQVIEQKLRSSGAVVVLLSKASLSSSWVDREVNVALEVLPRSAVLPVAVGEVDVRAMPTWLATRKWLHLRDSRHAQKLVDQLMPALETALGSRESDTGTARINGEPPPRTPLVGVDDYLRRLGSQQVGTTWIVGRAGTGKTGLAREYVHQLSSKVSFIWWLSCSTGPGDDIAAQLRRILGETTPADHGLVVVDGFDEIEDSSAALPQLEVLSRDHRIVITARHIADSEYMHSPGSSILTIGPLSYTDIARYLEVFAPQLRPTERAEITKIAESTDRSPLTLRLITQLLQGDRADVVLAALSRPGTTTDNTLRVLLDRLPPDQRHRLYALSFCSDLLSVVRSDDQWRLPEDDALFTRLLEWGLCSAQADRTVFTHQLIVDFLRASAPRAALEDALAYLAPRLPDPSEASAQSYLGSVTSLTDLAELDWGPGPSADLAELLIWQASVWRAAGEPERAEVLCPRALAMAEESGQALLLIRTMNLQSALAFDRGRLGQASDIERRAADLAVSELGSDHPIAIASLANLATSRRAQGDLPEAITLLRRVVELGRQTMKDEHPDLIATRINLAICLRDAGLADETLQLLDEIRSHTASRRVLLQVNQILAAVLVDTDRQEEAIAVLHETLEAMDREGLTGTTDALTARANLASVYARLGNLSEAAALQRDVTDQFAVNYGPDHPATLSARNKYAGLLVETGSPDEALQLLSDVASRRTRLLGPDHPDTLQSRLLVARVTSHQGDAYRALELYWELFPQVVRVLGPDHPTSLAVREEMALERARTGDVTGARLAFRELLADLERALSPGHPMTLRVAATVAEEKR